MKTTKIEVDYSTVKERQLRECHFSGEPFYESPGSLAYSYGGEPVSPDRARQVGFVVSEKLQLPPDVNDREKLGLFLTEKIGLDRNSPEFRRVYGKYADPLPVNFVPKPFNNQ